MSFWIIFILFFFPLCGGIAAAFIKDEKTLQLKYQFFSFSGAFLISVCSLNILPEIYHHGGRNHRILCFGWIFPSNSNRLIFERNRAWAFAYTPSK